MCQEIGCICMVVGLKNKKVYYLGTEQIKKLAAKGKADPDSHSVIRNFYRVSATQNWKYNVETGQLDCEAKDQMKHVDEVKKFVIRMYKGKTLAQIRALETIRGNTLVQNEAEYKKTLTRLKTYKDVKVVGEVCKCKECGQTV